MFLPPEDAKYPLNGCSNGFWPTRRARPRDYGVPEKLTPLLNLRYHNSLAVADLGRPAEINKVFSGFQKYLYQQQAST